MFEKVEKNYTKEGTRQAAHVCIFARYLQILTTVGCRLELSYRFQLRMMIPNTVS